jgi:nicotinamide-nucleotide amidase
MIETFQNGLPGDVHRLAEQVMVSVCERQWTLALAESCTGGLLAAVLTDIEGCAHGFDRGFVTYTNAAKTRQLGVPARLLELHGAVSKPVAAAMVEGTLAQSDADLALSVTGFAGPGAPDEEAGLVFFGLQRRGAALQVETRRFGDASRGAVRLACLRTSLSLLAAVAT